ncbi:hypothetical protein H8K90_16035 [Winogradskyella echinorum]|uniref:Uncharacterized protein n=1 Tax=Winogradskyella echinorum TaxID=538189 RepID=A0ABR6Y581_9FLAO|nr:DUF6090 family protein [Winogradskyella echinorum]MBC3847906.1 hypothetical protein [Winogradskyella echinorum]MBC5752254.1 hypothetical protein [Winogradskyella echinorum]
MIKFFRHIRQQLISENKTGKYLKYAIGEIVLVVIGILIALSINNWNEQRKVRTNERELLSSILKDLIIDENRINEHIKYYQDDQSMHYHIYQDSQGLLSNDTIIDFSTLRAARIFNLTIEASYSKYIKEISKNNIRVNIDDYFKQEDNVNDAMKVLSDYKESRLKLFLSKYGINDAKELFKNKQLDYYDLREKNIFSHSKLKDRYGSEELEQLLFDLGIKTSWALSALKGVLEANKELQLDLKNELSGKNVSVEK